MTPSFSTPRSTRSSHSGSSSRRARSRSAGLLLLATAPYLGALGHGFVYDDHAQVVRNALVRSPGLGAILAGGAVTHGTVEWYRPLTILSFAAEHSVTGLAPSVYHATNLVLHVANSFLVWSVASAWMGEPLAWIAAAFFAASAAHTEAVTPVFGRADLLAALFGLLAWRLAQSGAAFAAAVTFLAALLSKESAVALLPVVVLWTPRRAVHGALAASLGIYAGVRWLIVGGLLAEGSGLRYLENPLVEVGVVSRVATGLWLVLMYVRVFLWPHPLSAEYGYRQIPVIESPWDPRLGVVLVAGVAAWLVVRRSRPAAAGLGAFLVLLAPVSNAFFPIGTILAERLLYLPSIGLAICLGAVLLERRRFLVATVGVVVAANVALAAVRNRDWRSDEALFASTVRTAPLSARAHFNYGSLLLEKGETSRAQEYLQRAVDIAPIYPEAHNLLGTIALRRQQALEAERAFRRALRDAPDYPAALANLGNALVRQGRYAEARDILERALERDPQLASACLQLAFVLEQQGRRAQAVVLYKRAVSLDPTLEVARARAAELEAASR